MNSACMSLKSATIKPAWGACSQKLSLHVTKIPHNEAYSQKCYSITVLQGGKCKDELKKCVCRVIDHSHDRGKIKIKRSR